MKSEYDIQAEQFLLKHGIKCRITLSDSKPAHWEPAGHHYRVTLSRAADAPERYQMPVDGFPQPMRPNRLAFDFWGSVADMRAGNEPTPYDVLSCLSSDVNCPETFADYCSEFDADADSIKALQTFKRCASFGKRLRAFFTTEEQEALSQIN